MIIDGRISKFDKEIFVPADKSITHRLFILALCSQGECIVKNPLMSSDTLSTLSIVQELGATVKRSDNFVSIHGAGLDGFKEPSNVLDAGNSGTTMRLIAGLLASERRGLYIMTGDDSLRNRPMGRIIKPLKHMGANIFSRNGNLAPLVIVGAESGVNGIDYEMPLSSAQVKSALILASLRANAESKITEPLPSRDHTELLLQYLGCSLKKEGNSVFVSPADKINAFNLSVPGDPSSGAFFVVLAALIPGSRLVVKGVCLNPLRIGFVDVLKRMGADIELEIESRCPEVVGNIVVKGSGSLKATAIYAQEVPGLIDEIPILSVAMALAEGTSEISGAQDLRKKESDRIRAICLNLRNMGVNVREKEDGLTIGGTSSLVGTRIETFNDHRIAMAFTVAALLANKESSIDNPSCVNISFPDFYEKIAYLQG